MATDAPCFANAKAVASPMPLEPPVMNADFDAQMRAAVPEGGRAVLLCRSGVRSIAAARRATELGITAYNILEGFEGDADAQGQRGKRGGWRCHGLPWKQG